MLLVPYVLRPGSHGLGVFTEEAVLRGQKVYARLPGFCLRLTQDTLADLPPVVRAKMETYVYSGKGRHRQPGMLYFDADDSRFLNHSAQPNLIPIGDGDEYRAARDIRAGEELTCDYRGFAEPGDPLLGFTQYSSSQSL